MYVYIKNMYIRSSIAHTTAYGPLRFFAASNGPLLLHTVTYGPIQPWGRYGLLRTPTAPYGTRSPTPPYGPILSHTAPYSPLRYPTAYYGSLRSPIGEFVLVNFYWWIFMGELSLVDLLFFCVVNLLVNFW